MTSSLWEMLGQVVLVLVLTTAAGAALYGYRQRRRRVEGLALFAMSSGFEFAREDPFALTEHPFRLFSRGDGRACENVLWGEWRGVPVKAADFSYYTTTIDSKGRSSRRYHRYSIALAEIDAFLPNVSIERERPLTRLAGRLGFHDTEFENERFNRMFRIKAEDREFAYELIDARMMRWLLATGRDFGFEVAAGGILVFCPVRRPGDLIPLLGTAKGFHDHIPRMVWAEFGG